MTCGGLTHDARRLRTIGANRKFNIKDARIEINRWAVGDILKKYAGLLFLFYFSFFCSQNFH